MEFRPNFVPNFQSLTYRQACTQGESLHNIHGRFHGDDWQKKISDRFFSNSVN